MLNYEEFVESDTYGAFNDFISVKDAKKSGLIPEEYHNIFHDTCRCGSDMLISKNRTFIKCCDPRCPIKLGKMASQMFENFGTKNVGEGTTLPLMEELIRVKNDNSHIATLKLINDSWVPFNLLGAKEDIYYTALNQIFSQKYSLGDLISKLAIPSLDSSPKKIFSRFPTLDLFLQRANGDLRIPLADCGIYDLKVSYYLSTYLDDIKEAINLFKGNLTCNVYGTASIVITGSVFPEGRPMSRNEFIKYLNQLTLLEDGRQVLSVKECSAIQTCDVIIADSPSNSRKYRAGLERGVLMTSTDYVQLIKNIMEVQREVLQNG